MIDDLGTLYREHPYLLHATADSLQGPWQRQSFAIDETQGNRYVGAPCVVHFDGQYWMLFETMWNERRGLEMARSSDLVSWQRDRIEVITNQPSKRRDPCMFWDEQRGEWLIYLCSVEAPRSLITVCRSADLKTFSEPTVVLALDDHCPWGSLESPFVVPEQLILSFFTHSMHHYHETVVLVMTAMMPSTGLIR